MDAFTAALQTWPRRGVPDMPGAWLMSVAAQSRHRRASAESVGRAGAANFDGGGGAIAR